MPFELKHNDLAAPLTFNTPADVRAWAEKELAFWKELGATDLHSAQRARQEAERAINRVVSQSIAEKVNATQLEATLMSMTSVLCVADGSRGKLLTSLVRLGNEPKVISAALALLVGDDRMRTLAVDAHWALPTMKAVAHIESIEAGGNPQRLVQFLDSVATSEKQWTDMIERESARVAQADAQRKQLLALLQESIESARAKVAENTARHEDHIITTNEKYAKTFSLQSPMTYWKEKADRHEKEATVYRRWFSGILIGGIAALAVIGIQFLFPLLREKPDAYWAIVLFSIAIAVLAWPMRLTSKLYLVHRHLAEDALEREVIVRTFLALDEKTKLPDSDRNLLLAAMFRHAPISIASEESSSMSLPDIVAAKGIFKS